MIECKDYMGYVEGSDTGDIVWNHVVLCADGTPSIYKFRSPLYQNFKHIQCMKKNIDCGDIPVYSMVVFDDTCDISRVRFSRPNTTVTNYRSMIAQVLLLSANSRIMLTNDEIQVSYDVLRSVAGTPQENKAQFISAIRQKKTGISNKKVFVKYIGNNTKKGLENGQIYEVMNQDDDFFWLKGIPGKSLKSRFEIVTKACDNDKR